MSEQIYHRLLTELKGWRTGELALERVWNDIRNHPPYHQNDAADTHPHQEPNMSVIDTLKSDLEHVLEGHATDIENGLSVAAKVADNPLAQTVLGLAHVPAGLLTDLGAWLAKADAEFGKLTPPAPAPAEPVPGDPAPDNPATQVSGIAV